MAALRRGAALALALAAASASAARAGGGHGPRMMDDGDDGRGEEVGEASFSSWRAELDGRLHRELRLLGVGALMDMSLEFFPDIAYHRANKDVVIRRLMAPLFGVRQAEGRAMAGLSGPDLVGEFCRWLAAHRLRAMPSAAGLRQRTVGELQSVVTRLGIVAPRAREKQRYIAKLLSAAAVNATLRSELLEALPEARPVDRARQERRINECPVSVRMDVLPRASREERSGVAALRARLKHEFATFRYAALLDMTRAFLPDVPVFGPESFSSLFDLLVDRVPGCVPPGRELKLSKMRRDLLLGELCHWLSRRMRGMPSVEVLSMLTVAELKDILCSLAGDHFGKTQRKVLVAKIMALSFDAEARRRLFDMVPGAARSRRGSEGIGRLDECPESARLEVRAAPPSGR